MRTNRLIAVVALSGALLWAVSLINQSAQASPSLKPPAAPPWNTSVRVNDIAPAGPAARSAPAFAAKDSPTEMVYAVWQDERNGDADIYSAQSADAGQTWSFITRVNHDAPGQSQSSPDVAVSVSGTLHVVWQDSGVYYARSTNGGKTWSAEVKLNDSTGGVYPAVAVYTDTVCAAWEDTSAVRVDCSTNGGVNWDTPDLSAPSVGGTTPDLVVDSSGQVHVVWTDQRWGYEIYYARWAVSTGWSGAVKLNTDAVDALQQQPAIALNGSALVVSWQDNRSGNQIYARYSSNLGRTWSVSDAQVSDVGNVVGAPALTTGRGAVWATWIVLSGSDYIAYADTGTSTWGKDAQISTTTQPRQDIAAAGSASTVWAGWAQTNTLWAASRTTDAWGSAYQVNNTGEATQLYPALGAGNTGDLFAVWNDNRSAGAGLYAAQSTDGGLTWGTNNFVSGSVESGQPALAVTGTANLHTVWRVDEYLYWKIYYNRSTDGGSTWLSPTLLAQYLQVRRPETSVSPAVESPDVALLGNSVYAAWAAGGALYLAKSTNGGSTWGAPTNVFTTASGINVSASGKVALKASSADERLYLAWTNDSMRTCLASSLDGGSAWPERQCFNAGSATSAQNPVIALSPGWALIFWSDNRAGGLPHLYRATSGGTVKQVDDAAGPATFPAAVTAYEGPGYSPVVYVVWQDGRNGDDDLYGAISTDAGTTWQASSRVYDDSAGRPQQRPSMAYNHDYSPSQVWAAWQDFRRANWDIYATAITNTCAVPLTGVGISGTTSVLEGQSVALSSILTPSFASTPIGYEWQNPPDPMQDTATATYMWSAYGNQAVTLTASNCGGAFAKAQTVKVMCAVPITDVSFAVPNWVVAGSLFTLTAIMTPTSPATPTTIHWTPEPEAGQGTLQVQYRLHAIDQQMDAILVTLSAENCGGTWGGQASEQHWVNVRDLVAPVLSNFQPQGWVTQTQSGYTVPFSVTAQDIGSGLNVASAVAYYSNDGGVSFSAAQPVSVTGSYGTLDPQIISGQHDFGNESGPGLYSYNEIRLFITDTVSNSAAIWEDVWIDVTPPTNPTILTIRNLNSSIRPTNTWSASPTVQIDWNGASDGTYGSGLKDYLIVWTQSPTTLPDMSTAGVSTVNYPGPGGASITSQIPGDGQNWYFHLRTRDNAGLLAATVVHNGPYWLDGYPPSTPVLESSIPAANVWSNDNTLTIRWYPSTDDGSGVGGYSYGWDTNPTTDPGPFPDPTLTSGGVIYTTSLPLEFDGNNYYFHVNACDNAGSAYVIRNCSPALHVGPFRIDTQAPPMEGATPDRLINDWSNDNTLTMNWQNIDPHIASPKDRYSYVWDTASNTIPSSTPNLITTTVNINLTTALSDGSNHYFHLRTGDQAGNWSSSAFHLGPFFIDATPPAAPVIDTTSPIAGSWSNDKTVYVRWQRPPANGGGLVNTFSYVWNHSASTTPDEVPDFVTNNSLINTTSDPLPNGDDHYFHVRAQDPAGNWGPATHVGPFMIDATPPLLLADHGSGSAGSDVMLTGLVFPADITVTLSFTRTTGAPQVLGSFRTSYDGAFQVLASVPAEAVVGAHAFIAAGDGKTGRAAFAVTLGMTMGLQPGSVSPRAGLPTPSISVTLGNLNPNAAVVLETDWGTFNGPYPLNGAASLVKPVSVPKSTISGTHSITATARIDGVAVQRKAATFNVVQVTANIITQPYISLSVTHGQRGTVINAQGFNDWADAEEPIEDTDDVLVCPPGYEEDAALESWISAQGCPHFMGYKLVIDDREETDDLVVWSGGSFDGTTHVPDGWFDARPTGPKWSVESEVPWGATNVCLVGTIHRWYLTSDFQNGHLVTHLADSAPEDFEIACAPFTVDPPTPTFSAQYKLMAGTQYILPSKSPKIIVDGRSVGERGLTPPTVNRAYTATANTPITFTVQEGSYVVSAFACNYVPVQTQFTRGRGNQVQTTIQMEYTPFGGPAVISLKPDLQTFLYPAHPDRIGPFLSFDGVANPPAVDLPIIIELPGTDIASVSQVSATINGIPATIGTGGTTRIAKWNASLLPPGELTLRVQLKGHYENAGECSVEENWGPISQKTIVMAAAPPWMHSAYGVVSENTYDPVAQRYYMAGYLWQSVDVGDYPTGTSLGFLGYLKNYLNASIYVSQDFYIKTGTWTAQAKAAGGVSLMCLESLMGDCSEDYTLNLVAEPEGATVSSAADPAFPNRYVSDPPTYRAYDYTIDPIEVYNGIIASYWGIVNVHLSLNFGAGASLDIAPGLQSDLAPEITFLPQASINVPISLWVDILMGVASAGVDAIPSVTLAMPVHVDTGGVDVQGPNVCFRLSGRVWVAALFWDASFGPFNLLEAGSCALQALLQALTTTPPPSTLPAPALATDGYGHVLGAWVHDDSNHPSQNQGVLYSVYFDGASWGAQLPVAGSANLLVTDPAIAFAGENTAVAVFATNAPNATQPLTWTNVTQQLASQKLSYSIYNGVTWTAPATLDTGGGPHGRVTLAGDPYRGRAIAMWIHDDTGSGSTKRWLVKYSVYEAETNTWSTPANVDNTPTGSLDAEVSLAFDSAGQAMAIWVRQAGVEASSVITSPFTKNDLRTLVTAEWHPNEPDTWAVTAQTQAIGLPAGALMPDIAFDDNDQPIVAYALHQRDRDGQTATGFGNNAYLGYAIRTAVTTGYGPQATTVLSWTADVVPGVKGVEQPRVAMLPDDQAVLVFRGFGKSGSLDYQGVVMASTIDLHNHTSSLASAIANGNSWMNDAITTRRRADGAGALESQLLTMGVYNLGGQAASVRMSGASLRQVSLAGADPVMITQVPVLPDLAVTSADIVLAETLPLSGTQVPFTVTVRNLGLARNHQPVTVELIQDVGSLHETRIATGTVPIDLVFNGAYELIGQWPAVDGAHTLTARVQPPIADDVDGSNNAASINVGVPAAPDQLTGTADVGSASAGLAWLPVGGATLSHYHVYRAAGTGNFVRLADSIETRHTDSILKPGVAYRYAVSAVSAAGVESPLSSELALGSKAVYLPLIRR